MPLHRCSLMVLLALAASSGGCGAAPLPPGFTAADAAVFQHEHEADVSGELGPLSVVASHYVGPGQTLVLRVVEGQLVSDDGPSPALRLEVTDQGVRCLEGCGPTSLPIEGPYVATIERFSLSISPQSGSTRVLVHDPQAPGLTAFHGLAWFPVDPRFTVTAHFAPDPARPTVELSTSRGLTKSFVRAGVLSAELLGQSITVVGYQPSAAGDAKAPLLVPFTDPTTGTSSYPVGRYLEVTLPEGGPLVLDFNRATNPWCAYSEHFNCPIPPADNGLPLAIEAGEQTYGAH